MSSGIKWHEEGAVRNHYRQADARVLSTRGRRHRRELGETGMRDHRRWSGTSSLSEACGQHRLRYISNLSVAPSEMIVHTNIGTLKLMRISMMQPPVQRWPVNSAAAT
eukprot:CAMPEP_0183336678 /NCGR_PEP_ID=MMETSP0164_2-20130417/4584_1 /TAXON_ID=221442 /ORGANISM="Coccolithus pelagicus ssp braarudi, Strain PLY182g" /LENGTH=107 /DNA_ID=CAMNT_0025506249 /DNA_START=273 /DNA_END=596 /DNA_ORIENTATION=-